ncbi:hypothetical protein BDY19DRAFT_934569 [Irpex rosettiformis]|uniref:Uncharacterized protein n=1 Tax=Irpex rosettiformis TaxID=378272 RepID=A0ACB8UAF5_9APHY|nr:hypothetical protein BDY19DRAFT_934569 [Irpex rosettiformis]
MSSRGFKSSRYGSTLVEKCSLCGEECDKRGIAGHKRKCKRKKALDEVWDQLESERDVLRSRRGRHVTARQHEPSSAIEGAPMPSTGPSSIRSGSSQVVATSNEADKVEIDYADFGVHSDDCLPAAALPPPASPSTNDRPPTATPSPLLCTPCTADSLPPTQHDSARLPNLDDIKVEWHPNSRKATKTYRFEQYCEEQPSGDGFSASFEEPWHPFDCRGDFEFVELVHEAGMSHALTERLLKFIHRVRCGETELTFKSLADVRRAWDNASILYPTFSSSTISAPYNNVNYQFQFHHRSLWDWVVAQVEDPKLAQHFHWDAQHLSKFDGTKWVRFYEEPWSADMFWEVQSHIATTDPDGKPLGLIIWADKEKLSTFGTQKGHPIVARLSNLDESVRNSLGVGGGRVVGLVPVIDDDSGEKSKKPYIDWKNAVYHEAFRILLEQVATFSRTGYRMKCGDRCLRTLYPFIHIIAADYEEQCYFALIRGLHGNKPCPICLVPRGELSDLTVVHRERQEEHVQKLVETVEGKGAKEEKLKPLGLRAVRNAFWGVMRTNIYKALSFDRLHAYLLGLFLHLLRILKATIAQLDRKAQRFVDDSLNAVPSWPGLTHFKSLMSTDFNDGTKWANLSKVIIQCSFNVFPVQSSGYRVLMALRKYIECDVYVALRVQTSETLEDYDATIQQFGERLAAYSQSCASDESETSLDKDWDGIIKVHSHLHASRDIRLKGAMINMDTKTSERLHGPLRKAYQMRTNFKQVEGQLARLEDFSMVICDVRGTIDAWDEYMASQQEAEKEMKKENSRRVEFNHIALGSPRDPVKISTLEEAHRADDAFHGFQTKLLTCIRDLARRYGEAGQLGDLGPVTQDCVNITDTLTEYCYLRVRYESKVTWREEIDLLRCSSMFHGAPRHDSVIVDCGWDKPPIFCKLLYTFTYKFRGTVLALALVHPYDASLQSSSSRRRVDRDLALCRVAEQPRRQSRIVPLRAIRRGALLVGDSKRLREHLVIDALDGDMFLRCIDLFPSREMAAQIRLRI